MIYVFFVYKMMIWLFFIHLIQANGSPFILYTDISPVNISESFMKIMEIQLHHYKFKYDSVQDRKHIGVLGSIAQRYFPESVEVVPQYIIPHKNRSETITLTNYPVVDKNVILLHGLAAIQQLMMQYIELEKDMLIISEEEEDIIKLVNDMTMLLDDEASMTLIEQLHQARSEEQYLLDHIKHVESYQHDEKISSEMRIKEAKNALDRDEMILLKRLSHEERMMKESLSHKIELERKLAQQREELRRETQAKVQSKREEYHHIFESRKIELEKVKITAELEAKAKQEVENEELTIRKMKLQSKLDTDRILDIIRTTSQQIVMIMNDFISKPQQMMMLIVSILCVFVIYHMICEILIMLKTFFQLRLGRPSLVRETSKTWTIYAMVSSLYDLLWRPSLQYTSDYVNKHFEDVILTPENKERVIQLAIATRNTKRSAAPYRHVLLFGPAGTGKTLIARRLAQCSGMDYAIMSGGDVGPLGDDAVNQLHNLFSWASRSRRGLLIFIDESEAFLSSRGNDHESSNHSHALNALLYQTGSQSKHFMLVLATNRPEDIDAAILDRVDVSIHIDLPGTVERCSLLKQYYDMNIMKFIKASSYRAWFMFISTASQYHGEPDLMDNNHIWDELAMMCEGFSGREISKLFISLQCSLMISSSKILTQSMLYDLVRIKVQEHHQKQGFRHHYNITSDPLPSSYVAVHQRQDDDSSTIINPSTTSKTPRKTPRPPGSRKVAVNQT